MFKQTLFAAALGLATMAGGLGSTINTADAHDNHRRSGKNVTVGIHIESGRSHRRHYHGKRRYIHDDYRYCSPHRALRKARRQAGIHKAHIVRANHRGTVIHGYRRGWIVKVKIGNDCTIRRIRKIDRYHW